MHSPLQACVHVRINAGGAVSRRGFLRNVAGLAVGTAGLRKGIHYFADAAQQLVRIVRACVGAHARRRNARNRG